MREELQKKLFDEFPLLFTDRNKSMKQTCMCWGVACGDGWYNLIYEAASKIEKEIEKYMSKNPSDDCYQCGCNVLDHKPGIVDDMPCTNIHHLPYNFDSSGYGVRYIITKKEVKKAFKSWRNFKYFCRFYIWENSIIKSFLYKRINIVSNWVYEKFGIGYDKHCHCKGFETMHPRAIQVKEKFGMLRIYMDSCNDEVDKVIREAEIKSGKTCENCGAPGELRAQGWHFTLCDDCNKIREETGRAPWLR